MSAPSDRVLADRVPADRVLADRVMADWVLAPAELHALSRRTNLPGALRLGVHVALLVGTGWWLAVAGPWGWCRRSSRLV